jgi:hypothetical protein
MSISKQVISRRTFVETGVRLLTLIVVPGILRPSIENSQKIAYGSGRYGLGPYTGASSNIYLPIVKKEN